MAAGAETMKQFDETMLGLAKIGKISRERLPGTLCQVLTASDIQPPSSKIRRATERHATSMNAVKPALLRRFAMCGGTCSRRSRPSRARSACAASTRTRSPALLM